MELKNAVDTCIATSLDGVPDGTCTKGPYGSIGLWDVSSATDMTSIFAGATSFNGGISKWDVSNVTSMYRMFYGATSFNSDISEWDVSRVTNMGYMFHGATSFNINILSWDVSKVSNMRYMFRDAASFARTLCGAWRAPTAVKTDMFSGSGGKLCVSTGLFPTKSEWQALCVDCCTEPFPRR